MSSAPKKKESTAREKLNFDRETKKKSIPILNSSGSNIHILSKKSWLNRANIIRFFPFLTFNNKKEATISKLYVCRNYFFFGIHSTLISHRNSSSLHDSHSIIHSCTMNVGKKRKKTKQNIVLKKGIFLTSI